MEIAIFATGTDMLHLGPGIWALYGQLSYIAILGIPYIFFALGLILSKSEWVQMIITYGCIFLSLFAAVDFARSFQGVASLLMDIYALIIIFICLLFLWFGNQK